MPPSAAPINTLNESPSAEALASEPASDGAEGCRSEIRVLPQLVAHFGVRPLLLMLFRRG